MDKISGVDSVEVEIANGPIHIEAHEAVTLDSMIEKLHHLGYSLPGKGSGMTTASSYISCLIGKVTSPLFY